MLLDTGKVAVERGDCSAAGDSDLLPRHPESSQGCADVRPTWNGQDHASQSRRIRTSFLLLILACV